MMTRAAFLAAYREELKGYPWARDEAKLNRFMTTVEETLSASPTARIAWNHKGEAVNAAWKKIGGKRKNPSLKDLRELPATEKENAG